jgi:hypothetical protein
MTGIYLPAQSYEEALPDLRAPYQPSQIRPLIIAVPKNDQAPCKIALYTIGETLMDRFNLVCGPNWEPPKFTIDIHEEREKDRDGEKKTVHYFKITCSLTVFGVTREDFGEGEAESAALAEWDARAQAFKRTARWHGPGQCLYVFGGEEIVMLRGEGSGKLRVPKSGNEPHRRPYFDKAGKQAIRAEYARWLKDEGEDTFGPPLDHLAIAQAIRTRGNGYPKTATNGAKRTAPSQEPHNGNSSAAAPEKAPQTPTAKPSQAPTPTKAAKQSELAQESLGPIPDQPVPPAALDAAKSKGYGEPVARLLSNLARAEGQDSKQTDGQLQAVTSWLDALSALQVPEDVVLLKAGHNSSKPMSQERRQALFARWLARKTAGEHNTEADEPAKQPGPPQQASQDTDDKKAGASNGRSELQLAIAELRRRMKEHEYGDVAVTRFAALATGSGPRTQVKWNKIEPGMLLILADLLDSAAMIGWSDERLDQEVLAAHNNPRQNSTAGRFSALANHITDLAETRAMEPA